MKPEISVIITSYNRGKYISQAIESVINSSFQNFELIISDDCSKDHSYEIACEYAKSDERIKVHRNEINIGDYPNRILSIERSNGDWIKFVDCDDYISPNCLQEMLSFAKLSKAQFGICAPRITENKLLDSKEAISSGFLNYFGPTGSFFSKKKYQELGGFVNRITVSDWHMWHRFAMDGPIMIFPERLTTWRDHDDNTLKSESHFYGIIHYYLLSKYEILTDKNHPYDFHVRKRLFRKELMDTFKLCVRFAVKIKRIKPVLHFFRFNYNYLFILNFR
jgi:glycosyltransferase involved in cell wall biosynthesis